MDHSCQYGCDHLPCSLWVRLACQQRGELALPAVVCLAALPAGCKARIIGLDPALDAYFSKLAVFGILPGAVVSIVQTVPVMVIAIEHTRVALDKKLAKAVLVEPCSNLADPFHI